MAPEFPSGKRLFVNHNLYLNKLPQRWDVVTFVSPTNGVTWVKRVVGLPGETIHVTSNGVLINGKLVKVPARVKVNWSGSDGKEKFGVAMPIKIPPGNYFLMGDNSARSFDSRYWGPLPMNRITGGVIGGL